MGLDSIGSNPMFPNFMKQFDYVHFVGHLKLCIARRNLYFDTYLTTRTLRFLKLLYQLNVVRRYLHLNSKKYRIYTNWFGLHSPLLRLKFYNRSSDAITFSYKSLLVLTKTTFTSHIILSTSSGLMTHKQAIEARLGGMLVCIIT